MQICEEHTHSLTPSVTEDRAMTEHTTPAATAAAAAAHLVVYCIPRAEVPALL